MAESSSVQLQGAGHTVSLPADCYKILRELVSEALKARQIQATINARICLWCDKNYEDEVTSRTPRSRKFCSKACSKAHNDRDRHDPWRHVGGQVNYWDE